MGLDPGTYGPLAGGHAGHSGLEPGVRNSLSRAEYRTARLSSFQPFPGDLLHLSDLGY